MTTPQIERYGGMIAGITDRGFGFIRSQKWPKDLFFHSEELVNVQFDDLREGDEINFAVIDTTKGRFAAVNISKNGWFSLEESEEPPGEEELEAAESGTYVRQAVQVLSKFLAETIAENPSSLRAVEWRDLERTIAEVFSALGFRVELTPGSKDGGKDIILSFNHLRKSLCFFVEIKHWSSPVGPSSVKRFLHLIAHMGVSGGLMLATSGFSKQTFESFTSLDRETLFLGSGEKVVTLCRQYVASSRGIWIPPDNITRVITDGTE